jgi:ubiquinone/menaquinone biosynthesis C-methylase UbiE
MADYPKEEGFKQARKPTGEMGIKVLKSMNEGHAELIEWGLKYIPIPKKGMVLDIGCGGGRTLQILSNHSPLARIYGLDYSKTAIDLASILNKDAIGIGSMVILEGSVSNLPFDENLYDLVTAIETYFFWPDLQNDLREVNRILKPKGILIIICESYSDPRFDKRNREWEAKANFTNRTPSKLKQLMTNANFDNIQTHLIPEKNWITIIGEKPI